MNEEHNESDRVETAREEVIEAAARSAELYGLNRTYGRLYGILYFKEELVSLDNLTEESGYAKSTVSNAMQSMKRLHLVHRQSVPGEGKKAFYEAETDFWHIAQEFLRREVQHEISVMIRALSSAEKQLEKADGERAERDLERVRSFKTMYENSQTLVDFLTSERVDKFSALINRVRRSD